MNAKEAVIRRLAELWSNQKALCITAVFLSSLLTVVAWRDRSGFVFGERMSVRTTAYTHTEADHLVHGNRTAVGTALQHGRVTSAGTDWSVLPVGTEFKSTGRSGHYVVDDYGGALVGTETIDLYKPTKEAMNDWGVREVEITILKRGSVAESMKILEGRKSSSVAQRMLTRMREE